MNFKITAHIKQHAGDILNECQDSISINENNLSFSVADGVSQAYRPELWSRLLTKSFVNDPENFFIEQSGHIVINPSLNLKEIWASMVDKAYLEATEQEKFLLDMKKDAVGIGASTFIGVQIVSDRINYYTIGDSVLFFYSKNTKELSIISSMIPDNGEFVFNNSPEYIDTYEVNHGCVLKGDIPLEEGTLFMATDALSDWIIEQKDDFLNAVHRFISIGDHQSYDIFIDNLRAGIELPKIKDDDTSFIAIEITDNPVIKSHDIEFNNYEEFDSLIQKETKAELKKKIEENELIRSELSQSKLILRRKDKELKRFGDDVNALNNKVSDCESIISDLKEQLIGLNKTISSQNSEIIQLRSSSQAGSRKNKTLGDQIKKLQGDIQTLDSENKKLENERTLLAKRIKSLENAPTPKVSIQEYENKIKELEGELNISKSECAQLKLSIQEIQKLLAKIQSSYDSASSQLIDYSDLIILLDKYGGIVKVSEVTFIEKQTFNNPTNDGGFQIG